VCVTYLTTAFKRINAIGIDLQRVSEVFDRQIKLSRQSIRSTASQICCNNARVLGDQFTEQLNARSEIASINVQIAESCVVIVIRIHLDKYFQIHVPIFWSTSGLPTPCWTKPRAATAMLAWIDLSLTSTGWALFVEDMRNCSPSASAIGSTTPCWRLKVIGGRWSSSGSNGGGPSTKLALGAGAATGSGFDVTWGVTTCTFCWWGVWPKSEVVRSYFF